MDSLVYPCLLVPGPEKLSGGAAFSLLRIHEQIGVVLAGPRRQARVVFLDLGSTARSAFPTNRAATSPLGLTSIPDRHSVPGVNRIESSAEPCSAICRRSVLGTRSRRVTANSKLRAWMNGEPWPHSTSGVEQPAGPGSQRANEASFHKDRTSSVCHIMPRGVQRWRASNDCHERQVPGVL